jgi:hypothetical protein
LYYLDDDSTCEKSTGRLGYILLPMKQDWAVAVLIVAGLAAIAATRS